MFISLLDVRVQQALSALREIQTKAIELHVVNAQDGHVISMLAASVELFLIEATNQEVAHAS